MALVSTEQLGKACGITGRRIRQLVEVGLPRAAAGRYDLGVCMSWYIRYLQGLLEGKQGPEGNQLNDLRTERHKLLQLEREGLELDLQERRGQMVRLDVAEQWFGAACHRVRARLIGLPQRLAAVAVGATSVSEAQGRMEAVIAEVLDELRQGRDIPEPAPPAVRLVKVKP
jgi:phage terminase Nu1 subunit (DNA packaging protein)